ncbi:hypothetical protein TTHERM_002653491, partial (macronuclear) [Tetrahymena thermophila SB210]
LSCFQLVFIIQNITIQNKQTVFTQGQVSNLRDQCNLLNQNLSLMHLRHQFNYHFLNIEEKIYHKIVNQKEKMKKKYEIIRLINQQQ